MVEALKTDLINNPPAVVNFTSSCQRHDGCYDKRGSIKSACDTDFYKNLNEACRTGMPRDFPEVGRKACFDTAASANDIVRKWGCDAFMAAQKASGVSNPSCN
jgi:hypothetical protein